MLTYLLTNIFTILVPFSYSFERKIAYYRSWKYLFPAIFITGTFFIIWDIIFTDIGIWSFNPSYLTGIYLFNLPIEEWLFFLTVPYSCVFIYEAMNYYIKKDYLQPYAQHITYILAFLLLILAVLNHDKLYTFINFTFSALFLLAHIFIFKTKHLGRFYLAYLVHLIPFFLVNGLLTSLPVVLYNPTENLGVRIGSIPVEDSIYSMLLLLMNISIYEYLKTRKTKTMRDNK